MNLPQDSNATEPEQPLPNRWEVELEFVQSLANPVYLNYLAQNKYLESQEFLNFLEYLEYWRESKYAKFIVYPNCLHVLSLLQEPRFRQDIAREDVSTMFMDDFYMRWLNAAVNPDADIAKMAQEVSTKKDESSAIGSEAAASAAPTGTEPTAAPAPGQA